ncbi:MAG: DUF2764 family protein [Rikenellaceae bacterium]
MAKQYYCLVAGLKEYAIDGENKGLEISEIKEEIAEQLSKSDARAVELLYSFYDIENIINIIKGKTTFNSLGNFSQEQLTEEVSKPELLPSFISDIVISYANKDSDGVNDDLDIDLNDTIERNLWTAYYKECAKSKCSFLRKWGEFDLNLRNICAAYTARKSGLSAADIVVGNNDITQAIAKSSSADFGLKNEITDLEKLIATLDDSNILEKEHRLDMMRWSEAEEISTFDYFNINTVMAYLVKVNLIWRWKQLDRERGQQMFNKLLGELSGKDIVEAASKRED